MNQHSFPVQWVFRHAGGALIDTPDLPIPQRERADVFRWVATLWPDDTQPDSWAALEWTPAPRGWWVPNSLAIGDVIEFGVTWSTRFGRQHTSRWFGWIERATAFAVIVSGPYEHPECAIIDARPVVDELRLSQLASPWTSDDLVGVLPDSWDL